MNSIETNFSLIKDLIKTPLGTFELIITLIIRLCILVIFIAILINFMKSADRKNIQSQKKSVVETCTMIIFFLGFYWIIKSGIGTIEIQNMILRLFTIIFGTVIIVFGTVFNILGRLALGHNWANQVIIYQDQTLIKTGVYKIVRHPLYASLVWMFFAASIIYLNYFALLVNLLIFIPFMTYRAKQEEKALEKNFSNYVQYKKNVGMFFPKLGGKNETN